MNSMHSPIEFSRLGRVDYSEGLSLQSDLAEKRRRSEIPDTVLLLEHEPVYTIGRGKDKSSLSGGGKEQLPFPVIETNRGGQATFHGPGQLVGYLILDLHSYGMDLHVYLRNIESFLIDFLNEYGISAGRREGQTGVWVEDRKIASIGVGVRKWVSMHGFALNIGRDLSAFDAIVPCGIQDVEMTSLERELNLEISVEKSAEKIEPFIRETLKKLRSPQL